MNLHIPVVLAALLGCSALGSCGKSDVGGSGRLERVEGGGAGDHLILEGTPYEMGWWHGHLLKDRIRALHEEWQRQAFALDGDLMSADTQARRKAALALVEPVLQNHLPEAIRQEYQGLSDACGLPVRTLLLTEMITDVLRFTEKEPRLLDGWIDVHEGAVGLSPGGPWINTLAGRWLWISRKSEGRGSTSVLAWPGGLGGVMTVRANGLAATAVELRMDAGREGLGAVPFRVSLRLAGERAKGPADLLSALSHSTGHWVAAVDLPSGQGKQQVVALASDNVEEVQPNPLLGETGSSVPATRLRFVARREPDAIWVDWGRDDGRQQRLRVP